jgi:type I restriction enzyme S subunit
MSFVRYPDYKDSGVEWLGEVPRHWEVLALKKSFKIVGGSTPKSENESYWDGEILWATPSDLSKRESIYMGETQRKITDAGLASCGTSMVPASSIILSTRAPIGSLAIAEKDMCTNQGCKSLVPMKRTNTEYFAHLLSISTTELNVRGKGTTFLELSSDELGAFKTPAPPFAEQTQIAAFLDRETAKIDGLVAEQRRLMALLKEKRQAVISHAVTQGLNPHAPMKPSGNKWLGDVPAHWIVCCLKHIKAEVKNAFVDGPFGSNLKSEHFIDDGDVYVIESSFATQGRIDMYSLKTISNEHFFKINRSETRGGDIVIAKIGAQYGKASILPNLDKPAVVSGNSLKLTINQKSCNVKFVNWHLANLKELGVMEDIVNATAQPALSLGEMNNLPMLVPPRNEQVAIVQFLNEKLSEFDTLTAETQRAIDLLAERRTALISAAVTGQIDVRAQT